MSDMTLFRSRSSLRSVIEEVAECICFENLYFLIQKIHWLSRSRVCDSTLQMLEKLVDSFDKI